jgi:hypothetical protein
MFDIPSSSEIALGFIAIAFCSIATAETPCHPRLPKVGYEKAQQTIDSWVQDNHDTVSVGHGVIGDLSRTFAGNDKECGTAENAPPTLKERQYDFVINSYLYDLRDRKYALQGSPPFPKGNRIELRPSDVRAFSFATYSRSISPDSWADPGELSVVSSPPGVAITIDGQSRGMTNRDFVVSKGKHTIAVKLAKPCADTVEVKDDPVTFKCPKD